MIIDDIPCSNIIPNNTEIFNDSGGTARYARTFYLTSGTIKGTIIAFFGGTMTATSPVTVRTKGWSETSSS